MKTIDKYVLSAMLIAFLIINTATFAQVGIGTTSPNINSMLDIDVSSLGTKKGFMPPRMTTTEKNTLGTSLGLTDKGMLVFDNTLIAFYYWDGTQWLLLRIDTVITDEDSTANMYLSVTPYETPLSAGVVTKILGTTDCPVGVNNNFTHSGSGRLTYNGLKSKVFSVVCSLSFSGKISQTDDTYSFYISKNGSIDVSTKVKRFVKSSTDVGALSISGTILLNSGDWIEVWASSPTANTMVTHTYNLLIY